MEPRPARLGESEQFQVRSEDREFYALFLQTAEFKPDSKFYETYVHFNLGAVDRGDEVVRLLRRYRTLRGATALDVGAGSGGLAIALARAGARVCALEPDDRRAAWARARIRGYRADVELRSDVAEQLPFADESFDIVTADSVLEHVEDIEKSVLECCRVLKPDGVMFTSTPNKASLLNIRRDPHYFMFGVVLMPHRLGKWYVERIRKEPRGYWVNRIPTRAWLRREFRRGGVELAHITPPSFQKLSDPASIRHHPLVSRLAGVFLVFRLTPLLERIALHQDATNTFVGVKESAD